MNILPSCRLLRPILAGFVLRGCVLALCLLGLPFGGSLGAVHAAQAPTRRTTVARAKKAPARTAATRRPVVASKTSASKAKPAPKPKVAEDLPPQTGKPAPKGAGPRAPYRGAIAVDAATGRVLFADNEQTTGYPASVTKMMTFLLVLEDIQAGRIRLTDRAAASTYAASMEPSKIDLRPGETMSIEDLLFSLMIKSANDGAVVLAEHAAWVAAGGKGPIPQDDQARLRVASFVARMNRRAQELGMSSTRYASPNGLPPARTERRGFDTSTAADLAKLARQVVRIPGALRYTAPALRTVTKSDGTKVYLQNHNYFVPGNHDKQGLVRPFPGCDGLKTGYTAASGSSIVLTAQRNNRRVVVVVLGSAGRHEREAAAARILKDAVDALAFW